MSDVMDFKRSFTIMDKWSRTILKIEGDVSVNRNKLDSVDQHHNVQEEVLKYDITKLD